MATTLNLISKQTLGVDTSSVTFSNIPQTYTDLRVVVSTRIDNANGGMFVRLNNSSTNYSSRRLYADSGSMGSDAGSSSSFFMWTTGTWATSSTFGSNSIYIPNYTSSNYKSVEINSVNENNSSSPWAMGLVNGLWSDTSAVTSIVFIPEGAGTPNFVSGSTFYLYGIDKSTTQNSSVPKALGGDTITTNGTYWIHTFLSSGTFRPLTSLTCDYLVVAGGGGGGSQFGGGGGAGGLRSTVTATGGGGSLESALSLTAQAYTVTVGAGGAGAASGAGAEGRGSNGSNSVFSTITSTGGGGGGGNNLGGLSGGSGGGGDGRTTSGASGTTNQGYAGGNGVNHGASNAGGGGGGGAGAAGQTAPTNYGGAGGNGVAVSITGSSVTYAGGGGGGAGQNSTAAGTGGTGGGGTGGKGDGGNATAGTANTGGGAGGSQQSNSTITPAAGGSGIVIVRYAV